MDLWGTEMLRKTFFLTSAAILCAATIARAQPTTPPASTTPTSDKADALSAAARKGDAAAVRKLLDEGVDVNTKFRYNRTALSFAADRGHVDVVKLLLERGADIAVKDTFYGATAFNWAVSPAMDRTPTHIDVVRLFLKHGGLSADDLTGAL